MLSLRAGSNPQALVTTTPRRVAVLKPPILGEPTTVKTTDTTYANQAHLPAAFMAQIVGMYENTRLGRQEIHAEFLETTEGVWFANFDPARHISLEAEYHPGYHVRCAIDAGTSRHTAAVFYQMRSNTVDDRPRITVFGEYHCVDGVSVKNATAIRAVADELPCRGKLDVVRLDPAAVARRRGPGSLWRIRAGVRRAVPGPLAATSSAGRAGHDRADAGCGQADNSSAVREAEGSVRELLPPAAGWRVAGLSGRWTSGRRHDGRASRRDTRRAAGWGGQCAALPRIHASRLL